MVTFKVKCAKCRTNYAIASERTRFPVCDECKTKELDGEITDPKMKKMFDIPQEFYMKNSFLADIKIKYLRYGELSEKQVETFKRVVEDMKKA